MLKLQEFINENENWEESLKQEPYNLVIKKKPARQGEYVLFKYNQLTSNFDNPIVQEARGIIFRIIDNKTVLPVCVPFFKFFNLGEKNAAKLQGKITFLEKRDGSLCKLFYDEGKWHWATNGMIDAYEAMIEDLTNPNEKISYGNLIEQAKEYYYIQDLIQHNCLDTKLTYMFELTSHKAKLVVPYEGTRLTFLSARNNITLLEQNYNFGEYNTKILRPKVYEINDLTAAKNVVEHFNYKQEGLVAVDQNYNRVKIKSPAYLAISYLRLNGEVTRKRIIDIIRMGEDKEFLAYYPQYTTYFEEILQEIENYKQMTKNVIEEMCQVPLYSTREIYEKYEGEERYVAFEWFQKRLIHTWLYTLGTEQLDKRLTENKNNTKEINK